MARSASAEPVRVIATSDTKATNLLITFSEEDEAPRPISFYG
jgi:hypothetical protein